MYLYNYDLMCKSITTMAACNGYGYEIDGFYYFYKICHIKAPTRFVHNFWWWCSNLIKLLPIENWESGLSIGERISVWGHHNQKLWPNRIGTWMSTYHTILQKMWQKSYPYPSMGMIVLSFCRISWYWDTNSIRP